VKNSAFTGNGVDDIGGAIINMGILKITGSTFTNNTATNYGKGGAIMNNGTLKITGSTFTSNTAWAAGGAIYNTDSLTVADSTFKNNTATFSNGGGGAILNYGPGTLTVKSSTFTGNTANVGGAIYNYGTVTVSFSSIVGNKGSQGSAILNSAGFVNATDNWWGSNKPDFTTLITGKVNYNPWIILTLSANPKSLHVGWKSTITADLLHDSKGVYHNPANGVVPYTGSANFKTNKGSIKNTNFSNGLSKSTLTSLTTPGVAAVSAAVDSQTVKTNVTVKK
jgi:predicted outer membrane repeat protein